MSGRFVTLSPLGIMVEHKTELKGSAPYEPLRNLVGGYVERVQVKFEGRLRQAYVDEDGIQKKLLRNVLAERILTPRWQGAVIWGTLVIWIPDPRKRRSKIPALAAAQISEVGK